ncbi:MAG TPA: helix-turn-helix domain-containing protein [Bacillales bacterium]|nr:helix-turn-helix domain-containing protein [Bacillales bacterium]
MIEQLLELYKNEIIADAAETENPEDYAWFQSEDGSFGIEKSVLTEREKSLLTLFFTPFETGRHLPPKSAYWHSVLYSASSGDSPERPPESPFRFIHFYVKDSSIDHSAFEEAVDGLIPGHPVILWETGQQGVIVELFDAMHEESVHFEDLVDTIAGDFYTAMDLYVGFRLDGTSTVRETFATEKAGFKTCRRYFPERSVYFHAEQLPFLVLAEMRKHERKKLVGSLLGELSSDKELMNSVFEYLKSGLNVSTASKKLYIHRNSLQYRLDKFIEKTGLDIRSFPEAVTVYLALLEEHL